MSSAAPEASAEPVAAPAPAADDPNQVEKVLLGGVETASAQVSPRPTLSPSRSSLHSLINPTNGSEPSPVKAAEDVEMLDEEAGANGEDGLDDGEEAEGMEGVTGDEGEAAGDEEEVDDDEEEAEVEAEGDGDGEGEDEEEDEEEEEEEEEEDDDSDSDGAESEDLEPVITKVVGPNGAPDLVLSETTEVVKVEQAEGDVTMTDSVTITTTTVTDQPISSTTPAEEPAPNVLIPKKKKRQRSLSPEEELPPPPPPMRTLRLERPLIPESPMILWDILSEAQEKGMVPVLVKGLPVFVTDIEGGLEALGELPQKEKAPALAISDLIGQAEPKLGESSRSTLPLTEADKERLEMEAIARRLEEQYDKPAAKKRKAKGDDYDIRDEFIDDSELTIDRPTHYQKPKKEGFFVSQGQVELMEEPVPSPMKARATGDKSKKKRMSMGKAGKQKEQASPSKGEGSRLSPIRLEESDDEAKKARQAEYDERQRTLPSPGPEDVVDRLLYKHASKDKAHLPPFPTHHPRLVAAFRTLREAAKKEPWVDKKKFPDGLKPLLSEAAKVAIELDCFDEAFFCCLPSLLPYNMFTLRKLSTKLSFEFHTQFLDRRETELIDKFKAEVDKQTPLWRARHDEASTMYQADLEAWENGEAERARLLAENPRPYSTHDNTDLATLPNANDATSDPRPKEPVTRFLFTESLREIFGGLLENGSNWATLMSAMIQYDGPTVAPFIKGFGQNLDAGKKKDLYRKLCPLFPEGSMQTIQLSREMTKLKNRKIKSG